MIRIYEKGLPNTISVNGEPILINTDFRLWIRFIIDTNNADEYYNPDLSYILIEPREITEELYLALVSFCTDKSLYPRVLESKKKVSKTENDLIDYEYDGDFIYASFMREYNIDLVDVEMHWYKYLSLLNGLCLKYEDILFYRSYKGKDRDMLDMKTAWTIIKQKPKDDLANREFERLIKLANKE